MMTEQDTNNNNPLPRESVINTAVKFLQNPKVSPSPIKQKQQFLRSKGLTEEEIKRAFDLANVGVPAEIHNEFTVVPIPPNHSSPQFFYQMHQPTIFQRVTQVFTTAAMISGTLYCVYWFYKKFIEPFLFGRKKDDSVKEKVSELDKTLKNSVKEMQESISKVEGCMKRLSQNQIPDPTIPHLVQELKQDLASLKGLLLSRKQFPTAPPSIPTWQLEAGSQSREKSGEREDDAGSGSSTNNSDSSLEMIREDPPK